MTSAQAYFANCSNDNNNPAFSKNSPLWKPLKTCVFGARKRRRGRRKAKQPGSEYGGKNRFQRYPDTCWQGLNQESLLKERRQRQRQKSIGFTSKKVALHLHHEFYYIFWRPNATFYGGLENILRRIFLSLFEPRWSPKLRIQWLQEKSPTFVDELSRSKETQ